MHHNQPLGFERRKLLSNPFILQQDQLLDVTEWRPLRSGIALHRGAAFFGNVGAPQRLDFTVIGKAVNAASRVESLSKTLGHSILMTKTVAELLDEPLVHLGEHELRGLEQPVSIYAPAVNVTGT